MKYLLMTVITFDAAKGTTRDFNPVSDSYSIQNVQLTILAMLWSDLIFILIRLISQIYIQEFASILKTMIELLIK